MRALFVTDEFPWPADNGYRIRVDNLLRAVTTVADVDLFAASDARDPDTRVVPDDVHVARVCSVDRQLLVHDKLDVVRWAIGKQPRALAWRKWDQVAPHLVSFVQPPYDLVWFSHCDAFLALAQTRDEPVVVDLDNLESSRLGHRVTGGGRGSLPARLADRVDRRRWTRVEHRLADEVSEVLVCSDLDARRLGRANVSVVPNGYEPAPGVGHTPRPLAEGPLTAVFVGLLTFPPNIDAARFLANEVWPLVSRSVPGAELRIIGRGGDGLGALGPNITATGAVADLDGELSRAHLATVPIRYGGGTRIKLLEAFAYGIPTVSTHVGAEGIDVVHGQHLHLVDDAGDFAAACVSLLTDEIQRNTMAAAAYELWRERYQWAPIRGAVSTLVRAVHERHRLHAGPSRGSSSHG